MMGISEHYEFVVPPLPAQDRQQEFADYLYTPGAATDDQWNGLWGIMRAYDAKRNGEICSQLPNNPKKTTPASPNQGDFSGRLPEDGATQPFDVTAVLREGRAARRDARLQQPPRNRAASSTTRRPSSTSHDRPRHRRQAQERRPPIEPLVLRATRATASN